INPRDTRAAAPVSPNRVAPAVLVSPAPATQPATPLASLRVLAKAIKNGDAETVRDYLEAQTPQQKLVCEKQAKLCHTLFEMRKAYGEAYGAAALKKL